MQTITKHLEPMLINDLGIMPISEGSKYKKRFGIYKCECGKEFKAQFASIKNGNTTSCGCYRKKMIIESITTHGLRSHILYHTWNNMIQRTRNKKNKYYFGKGIIVCERWLRFENFLEDMYPSYQNGLTIDRINSDGNYEPSNCRWATKSTQSQNTMLLCSTNTSGYRGVSFIKPSNKWGARICVDRKIKHFGFFDTAIEAAKAYDKYVIDNNLKHTINGVL